MLGAPFGPLETQSPGVDPARIEVLDVADGWAVPLPAEWQREDRTALTRYEDDEIAVVIQDGGITAYNRAVQHAVVQTPDAETIPPGERDTRLRYAFQLALAARGRSMVHAAVVGEGDRGALIPGRSGSGKSTLSVGCALAGLSFCADDYVIVEPEGLRAHALLTTAKLSRWSIAALGLEGADSRVYDNRGFIAPKATVDVRDVAPAALRPSMQIACVVVPVIGEGVAAEFEQISRAAALRALAPSTIYQQPTRDDELLRAMARVVGGVPCFELRLGSDPAANAAAVRRALASAPPAS